MEIACVLKKYNGKKITRRILAAIKTALGPAREVYWDHSSSFLQLRVWDRATGWDNRETFLIGYNEEPTTPGLRGCNLQCYRAESFEVADACHGAAARIRQDKRRALLEDGDCLRSLAMRIQNAADSHNLLVGFLNDIENSVSYAIQEAMK